MSTPVNCVRLVETCTVRACCVRQQRVAIRRGALLNVPKTPRLDRTSSNPICIEHMFVDAAVGRSNGAIPDIWVSLREHGPFWWPVLRRAAVHLLDDVVLLELFVLPLLLLSVIS